MKFSDYNFTEGIHKSLNNMGFKRPTDIQFKSIPNILKGEDVLAIAQTGTGKTAAFAIPIISLLHERKKTHRKDGIKCLIMVPTHELAIQIFEVFEKIAAHTTVKTMCLIGGVDQDPQIKTLDKGVDILIATPGRIFDLQHQGHLLLHRVEILVLDEADHMLKVGFYKDIEDIHKFLPKKRQTLFFSATLDTEIKKLAYALVKSTAIRIQISPKDPVNKNVNHAVALVEAEDKRFFLERIVIENPDSKILVFVRTKVRAERVQKAMARVNISTETLHSDKEQEERIKILNNFRKGILKILIATDISARGIDIEDVDFVINYDLPDKVENYVHRIGRTGRAKKKGEALSLCSSEEKAMLEEIEAYLDKPIQMMKISKTAYKETIEIEEEQEDDWQSVIKEIEALENELNTPKKKRRK